MAVKKYAAKVTIGGAIEASFKNAFGSASDAIKKLGSEVKSLSRQRADIRAFSESSAKIDKFKASLNEANAELAQARAALAAAEKPTAALTRAVDAADRKVKGLERSLEKENATLTGLKTKLDQAGISTANLERHDAKLEARIRRVTTAMRNQEAATARFSKARGQFGTMMGAGLTVGAAALAFAPAIKASNQFADSMVDVGKYVDGANTPEKLKEVGEAIRDIGRNSPLGIKGITDLTIGAGKLGMASDDALKFAKAMETMSAGLDLSSEEAADMLTKIKSGMKLTIPETLKLGDAMNYLGDVTAADSKRIVDIMMRQGATVRSTTKMTSEEIAALAASFDIASPNAETAATAMKNFTKALTKGKAATKGNLWAYGMLKLDSVKVAEGMQKDAKKTIDLVLRQFEKVADKDKGAVAARLFGEESKGAILNMVGNYELLAKSFRDVNDESKYLGRSQQEQQRNLGKFSVQWGIFKSQINDTNIAIGDAVKEGFMPLLKQVNPLLEKFAKWRKENEKFFKRIVIGTAAVVAFTGAVVALGIAIAAVNVAWSGLAVAWAGIGVIAAAAGVPIIGLIGIIGGVAVVVAAAAAAIYKYWEPIKAFFTGLWTGIKEGWESAGGPELWNEFVETFKWAGGEVMKLLKPMTGDFGEVFESGKKFGEFIGVALVGLLRLVMHPLEMLDATVKGLGDTFNNTVTAIRTSLEPFLLWLNEQLDNVNGMIGSMMESLSSIGGSLPTWLGGGGGQPDLPNKTSFVPPPMRGGGDGEIKINVNAAPGQSEEGVAAAVWRRFKAERELMNRGNLNDAIYE